MNDRLTKIAEIIAQQGFSNYRLRLIGNTRTAALELRGLSDADMAALGQEQQKIVVEAAEPESEPPADEKNTTRMSFFGEKSVDSE